MFYVFSYPLLHFTGSINSKSDCDYLIDIGTARLQYPQISGHKHPGFAARIIRENPYECNINSKIKILEGLDKKLFVEQTIDDYLTKHCSKDKNVTEIFENENYDYASVRIKIKEILELISRYPFALFFSL